MQELGWVDATVDGAVQSATVTREQLDQYRGADEHCRTAVDFRVVPEEVWLSDENLARLYDLEVATSRCLSEHGYDPGVIPSKQAFTDEYRGGAGGWTAFASLPPLDEKQYREISELCPQASQVQGNDLWQQLYGK